MSPTSTLACTRHSYSSTTWFPPPLGCSVCTQRSNGGSCSSTQRADMAPSLLSLKEVLQNVRRTISDHALVVKWALVSWLEAVQQLPKHPSYPHTAAAMQLVQDAHRKVHLDMTEQEKLAWATRHVPGAAAAIAVQLDTQTDICLKRIGILHQMKQNLEQPSVCEQQQASSQLLERIKSELAACTLLHCALDTYREIGAVAALITAAAKLEDIANMVQRGMRSRRKQLSEEQRLVNVVLIETSEELLEVIKRSEQVQRVWEVYGQLGMTACWGALDYATRLTRGAADAVVALAAGCWMVAALRFPSCTEHACRLLSMAMFNSLVDWNALLRSADAQNPHVREFLRKQICRALTRPALRGILLEGMEPQSTGLLLHKYQITPEHLQALALSDISLQELLLWKGQAVSSVQGGSKETQQECKADQTGSSDGSNGADIDVADGLGDMQELLKLCMALPLH